MGNRREFIQKSVLSTSFLASMAWLSPLIANTSKTQKFTDIGWDQLRSQFLFKNDLFHFNIASLGPTSELVLNRINEVNRELASKARDGRWLFTEAREVLGNFVNAYPAHLSFTRNTTEGMNLAAKAIPFKEGDEIILTDQEHVGGAAPFIALQKSKGVNVKIAKLNPKGNGLFESIQSMVSDKTKAIVFSHVCCSNGMILPAEKIIGFCRKNNIYSVVDGAQAAGMLSLDLDALSPDFYAASGHKWMYGPIGSGFLYTNNEILQSLDPVFAGAYSDSKFDLGSLALDYLKTASRDEYGTRNAANVAALAVAIELLNELNLDQIQSMSMNYRGILYDFLSNQDHVEIMSPKEECHHAILSFKSNRVSSKEIVDQLRKEYKIKLRYVYEGNLDAVRISIPIYTSEKEMKYLQNSLRSIFKA